MTRLRALMTAQLLVIGALVISACQPEHDPRAADVAILVTVLSPDGAGDADWVWGVFAIEALNLEG